MRKKFRQYKRTYRLVQQSQARRLKRVQRQSKKRFRLIRDHPFLWPTLLLIILLVGFGFFIVSPGGQSIQKVSDSRIVIISHDGHTQTVPTKAPTVGVLLHEQSITLNQGDVVEPSPTTLIKQDDFRINIYRAQPVEIVDGVNHTFAFSAATTSRSISQQAGVTVYPEDSLSLIPTTNFLQDQAIGERIVINRAIPVLVNVYGTPTVIRTHTASVRSLLAEKHIVLAKDDSVVPALNTPLTPQIQVFLIHKGTQIVTVTQTIPMQVQAIEDNTLAYGTSATRQQGSDGREIDTYQVNLENGKEVSRSLIQKVVTQQPVTEIVVQGTNLSGIKGDMALAGIAPEDYQYADYIISHESGWCPTKAQGEHYCPVTPDNAYTSNGYGLCQATPGTKMASAGSDWATNPVTQLSWCSGYAGRYGGWYGSYQHWLAYHSW